MPPRNRLMLLAQKRGYYFDEFNQEWCKWTEYGEHAIEIYVDKESGFVGWCLYGPEERHGFFSCLTWGFANTLDEAEMAAKKDIKYYGGFIP